MLVSTGRGDDSSPVSRSRPTATWRCVEHPGGGSVERHGWAEAALRHTAVSFEWEHHSSPSGNIHDLSAQELIGFLDRERCIERSGNRCCSWEPMGDVRPQGDHVGDVLWLGAIQLHQEQR